MTIKQLFYGIFYCHKLPERSFFWQGRQFPLCSRCTGIALGYILGIVLLPFFNTPAPWSYFVMSLPLVIDGIFQHYGYWESTNLIRFITGILFGSAVIFLAKVILVSSYLQGRSLGLLFRKYLESYL